MPGLTASRAGSDRCVGRPHRRFAHTVQMDWFASGIVPTGRRLVVPHVGIVAFEGCKISSEHIYWDQATVLLQLGILEHGLPALGGGLVKNGVKPRLESLIQEGALVASPILGRKQERRGSIARRGSARSEPLQRPSMARWRWHDEELDSCITPFVISGAICHRPRKYLFWDFIHPTRAAHDYLSEQAQAIVETGRIGQPGQLGVLHHLVQDGENVQARDHGFRQSDAQGVEGQRVAGIVALRELPPERLRRRAESPERWRVADTRQVQDQERAGANGIELLDRGGGRRERLLEDARGVVRTRTRRESLERIAQARKASLARQHRRSRLAGCGNSRGRRCIW
jgi:hypothetical protein